MAPAVPTARATSLAVVGAVAVVVAATTTCRTRPSTTAVVTTAAVSTTKPVVGVGPVVVGVVSAAVVAALGRAWVRGVAGPGSGPGVVRVLVGWLLSRPRWAGVGWPVVLVVPAVA